MKLKISKTDQKRLRELEQELWIQETRFNRSYMEKVFASDFFEIGRSGRIHSRESCLSHENQTLNAVIPLQDLNIRSLSQDMAQVTYNSEVDHDGVIEKARRSSIWIRANESWILKFHQGTPYEE